ATAANRRGRGSAVRCCAGPNRTSPHTAKEGTPTVEQKRHLVYPSVALASLSTLFFELTQTRILSHIFWNQIVYLTVALALLGFGISGTLVAVFSAKRNLFTPGIMSRLWLGFGLSMFAAIAFTAWGLPLLNGLPGLAKLAFCYVIYVFPFVFSG